MATILLQRPWTGLGADDDLLPLPQGALRPPADYRPGGVALSGAAVADGRG